MGVLVRADQFRLLEHVPGHRTLEVGLRRFTEVAELVVECVELEEVAVASFRRAGSGIAGLAAIVEPFPKTVLVEAGRGFRDGVDDPMHEGAGWRGWIGGI